MTAYPTITFIEGLPGCGKTTIANWLGEGKRDTGLFLEDSAGYPNDFSGMVCISSGLYEELSEQYPLLRQCSFPSGLQMVVSLQAVGSAYLDRPELHQQLQEWEIADEFNRNITVSHYRICSLGLLRHWLSAPSHLTKRNLVLDSSWLQNPLNELLYRNADVRTVLDYCETFSRIFAKYNRRCIYLKRRDAAYSVWYASKVKGDGWTRRVAEHISRTPYGQAHQLSGLSGMIQFFGRRAQLEEMILERQMMPTRICDVAGDDWVQVREQIRGFLR